MNKYLITGFSGFVSSHFLDYLEHQGKPVSILGIDVNQPVNMDENYKYIKWEFRRLNLLDQEDIEKLIFDFQPNYILHLAAYSSVGFSWREPVLSFTNNTNIFLNLIESVRKLKLKCRILSVGSSEEYGNVSKSKLPITEETPLTPVSPYAVARLSQEWLSRLYINGYGMDIVLTRSFNHIGPGQKEIFVISSFVKQLVEIKNKGIKTGNIITGDISLVRDFLDVRDVVVAYDYLFKGGRNGEVYNICSGVGYSLQQILEKMQELLQINVTVTIDKNLIRPNDNKIIIGSNKKLKQETGWENKINIDNSLMDIIRFWENNN